MSEIWSLNALCRCCHKDGTYKSLNLTYNYMGKIEVYADMLLNTFGIFLNPPLIEASYSICDNCIKELRNALQFKKQIEECEMKFENYCKNELTCPSDIRLESADAYDDNYNYTHKNDDSASLNIFNNDYKHKPEEKILQTTQEKKDSLENERFEDSGNPRCKTKLLNKITSNKPTVKFSNDYTCHLCNGIFDTLKVLTLHIKKQHTNPLTCNICSERFDTKNNLKLHLPKHSKVSAHDCTICGKTYKSLHKMLDHRITHTNNVDFICDLCNKNFLYKSTLRKHIEWHNGTNKKFMCDICGNSFNDKSNLNIHLRTVHEKLRMFKCSLCPKTYAAKKALKVHYRTHTGERPYKCEPCGKAFICSSALGNHKKIHDNMSKFGGKYVCKVCGAVYDHRGRFAAHTRSHIGVKPHKCVMCDKDFTCHYSLKRHIEGHDGIKRFSCDICHTKFGGKAQLQRHARNLHDPNKMNKQKIKCDLCKMYITDMEKHMKSHLNRALQCSYCSKTYSETSALNRHVKQTHSGVSHGCDICGRKYVKFASLQGHRVKKHNIHIKDEEKTKQLECEDNSSTQFI